MSKKDKKIKDKKITEPNKQKIIDAYEDEEFLFADGYDDAIIGISEVCG